MTDNNNEAAQTFTPNEAVHHPSYYQADGIEAIDVIEAFDLNFNLGNVIKYTLRAGRKDASRLIEDLEKAKFYIQRELETLGVVAGRVDEQNLAAEKDSRIKKLMQNVQLTESCWLWTGCTTHQGYGRLRWQGRVRIAHRFAYETFYGAIKKDYQIDHKCRVRNCVNPAHLEEVTQLENLRRVRYFNAQKTHCYRGHPYDEENTYQYADRRRECRICRRNRWRKYREKIRQVGSSQKIA